MKTVNSISGGKTSAYIAVHYPADYELFSCVCIDDPACAPKDRALVQYISAKLENYHPRYGEFIATAEDDATLVALMELEQLIGREIIWVRGKSFDQVIDTPGMRGMRTMLPNKHFRYCTEEMKLLPMFEWWFGNIGEKVNKRIGFRFDEYARMERFMNNRKPFRIPVACSTKGKRLQKHQDFDWEYLSFPLVRDGITKLIVNDFWRGKIAFPEISNCIHCFWKKPETLFIMANMHPEKMEWAARQEHKGKGRWKLSTGIAYDTIIQNAENWIPEMLKETGATCDSGGCHD